MTNITVDLHGSPPWVLTLIPRAPPASLANKNYPLGINLENLTDWNRAMPFTDVFKLSRAWIPQLVTGGPFNTGTPINTDADGWVTSLAPGDAVMAIMMTNQEGNYPTGRYVCLYDGDGGTNSDAFQIGNLDGVKVAGTATAGRFEVDVKPSKYYMSFRIIAINPADPIRNIRFILPGYESTYATTNVFHPTFLSTLADFKILRFLGWANTPRTTQVTWAGRARNTSCRMTGPNGASLEAMISLCNKLQADMWYCVPHMADDDCVTQIATLIRDTLDPNLRLFLENSNEVWNGIFPAATWSYNRGRALWPNDPLAGLHYYGLRTAQMMDLAWAVFASETPGRLVRIMGTQSANWGVATAVLDQLVSGAGDFAYLHVDALAVAPYFGALVDDTMTVDDVLDGCAANSLSQNGPGGHAEDNFDIAAARGLELIAYEGGQHLIGGTDPTKLALVIAANRHPRMRQLYADDMARWTANGGGLYVPYMHTFAPNQFGCWGLFEKITDNPTTAYKLRGLQDWLATQLK